MQRSAATAGEEIAGIPALMGEQAEELTREASALAEDASAFAEEMGDLQGYLTEQVRERPFRTLGTAAGIGYVLGGGLNSRLTESLVGVAARLTTALSVLRELAEISEHVQATESRTAISRRPRRA